MKIGIIGCGTMGSGIAQRLGLQHTLAIYDRDEDWINELSRITGAKACKSIAEVFQSSDVIILAVKPQNLLTVSKDAKQNLSKDKLVISMLAGTTISTLKQQFGHTPILRMMPNLAAIFGKGVIGLVENKDLSAKMKKNVEKMCEELGSVYWLPEDKIDALTALTGSGPAFTFVIIESMVDAAIAMGFGPEEAQKFILEMLEGSIDILRTTDKHPAQLKWQVTSPAGTTIAGIKKMEEAGVRQGIINTFLATYQRAKELANEK